MPIGSVAFAVSNRYSSGSMKLLQCATNASAPTATAVARVSGSTTCHHTRSGPMPASRAASIRSRGIPRVLQ